MAVVKAGPFIRPGMQPRDILLNAMIDPQVERFAPGTIWARVVWYEWPQNSLKAQVFCLICGKDIGLPTSCSATVLAAHGRTHAPDELVEAFEALMRLTDPRTALQQLVQTNQVT